jgi:hypothetical protein
MAPNLRPGTFRTVSRINERNPPVGVNQTRPGLQFVHLNAPVATVWHFLVSMQNARLTASAIVGSQGSWPQHLSAQRGRVSLHRGD